MENVIKLVDRKELHKIIEDKTGSNKFAIGVYCGEDLITYTSTELSDMEFVYLITTLSDIRNDSVEDI